MHEPPRWARRWLTWILPGDPRGGAVAGDLEEEFARRAEGAGPFDDSAARRARRWYAREAMAVGARYTFERLRRFFHRRRAGRYASADPDRSHTKGRGRSLRLALGGAVRFVPRHLRLVAVVALLVGPCLGINVVLFSVIDGMLFRALPYPDSRDLVQLLTRDRDTGQAFATISYPEFRVARQTSDLADAAAFWAIGELLTVEGLSQAWDYPVAKVDDRLLYVLQTGLQRGRPFLAADVHDGRRVAIISPRVWNDLFGRANDVVGRSLRTSTGLYEIVGVLPADFLFPSFVGRQPEILLPFRGTELASPTMRVMAVARLVPGARAARVETDLNARLAAQGLASRGRTDLSVTELLTALFELHRPVLWLLLAAGVTVLVAAAANLAVLLLDVAEERHVEFAIRVALGAERRTLVLQVIAESLGLVAIAGAAALLACNMSYGLVIRSLPSDTYRIMSHGVDGRTIAVVLASVLGIVAVGAVGVVAGLVRMRTGNELYASASSGRAKLRKYSPLVASQIAIATAVAIIAAAVLGALLRLTPARLGYDPSNAVMVQVRTPRQHYPTRADRARLYERVLMALRQARGVTSAGASNALPLLGAAPESGLPSNSTLPGAAVWRATPGYFASVSIPIEGRDFSTADMDASTTAIVSASFAARAWPGRSALGERVNMGPGTPSREVIAVVGDVSPSFSRAGRPAIYLPGRRDSLGDLRIVARTEHGAARGARMLNDILKAIDPRIVLTVTPIEDQIARHLAYPRFQARLFSVLALLALVLATSATYVVGRRSVTARRQEFGVRLALGASVRDLRAHLVAMQLPALAVGVAAGLPLAYWARQFLVLLVGEVGRPVPAAWIGIAAAFVVLSLVAALAAFRRLSSIDPARLLRAT